MTARPLAPEADLAHVLDLAKIALRTGTMIDPEDLLCDLLGLDQADLHVYLTDPDQAATWDALRSVEARMAELGYFEEQHEQEAAPAWQHNPEEAPSAAPEACQGWPEGRCPACIARNRPCEALLSAPDQSQPASRARVWRQAEAGVVPHLLVSGRPLCAADDAGPWRTVAGVTKCTACLELEEVLGRHG